MKNSDNLRHGFFLLNQYLLLSSLSNMFDKPTSPSFVFANTYFTLKL